MLMAAPSRAQSQEDPFALKVLRDTDMTLSCTALVDEAELMHAIMQTTENMEAESRFNKNAISAAGALGSFLIGSVTGGLGLGVAGYLAGQEMEYDIDRADEVNDIAAQRRTLMIGLHKAQSCTNPIEHAMAPIEEDLPLDINAERLATLKPAAGSSYNETPKYND